MMRRKTRAVWMAVLMVMAMCMGADQSRADSAFGFNYWPNGYSCNILNDANWTATNRAIFERSLDEMRSLRTEVIRFMFWPESSGYLTQSGSGPGGGLFTTDFTEQTTNLIELLGYCAARDVKVIICFGNSYYSGGPNGSYWWQLFYGNTDAGWNNFMLDTKYWINGFVNSIQNSAYASSVLYYDYQNEWYAPTTRSASYATTLYDGCTGIPSGKRGFSILRVDSSWPYSGDDVAYLKSALGTGRPLDFVDYHCYPAVGLNSNLEACYDSVANRYPNSTLVLGEFGRTCANESQEAAQVATVTDVAARAINKGIPIYLQWMLWDYAPPASDQTCGWGYDAHRPKDVYGSMCDLLSMADNADAEDVSGGIPTGWCAGSSDGLNTTFMAMGPYNTDAATNSYYARIRRDSDTGMAFMLAPIFPVIGGTRLYTSCYIRSSMVDVFMGVNEYDANYQLIHQTYSNFFTLPTWAWFDFTGMNGSWNVLLDDDTAYVVIGIGGFSQTNPCYLDVDALSVWSN